MFIVGAPGEIRTHTLQILSLLPLPLGYRGIKLVGLERFELSRLATLDPKSSVSAVPPQPHGASGETRTHGNHFIRMAPSPLGYARVSIGVLLRFFIYPFPLSHISNADCLRRSLFAGGS